MPFEDPVYDNMVEGTYGNQMQGGYGGYGDQQAAITGMRASYGNVPGYTMMGVSNFGGAVSSGMNNMLTDLGRHIMPVTYTPPARMMTGYAGHYMQQTGFMRGALGMVGLSPPPPRGTSYLEHGMYMAGDFGERLGSGVVAGGLAAGGIAFGATAGSMLGGVLGGALGAPLGPVGMAAGAFIGRTFGGYVMGAMGADAIGDAVKQRREMDNYLEASSFRWATSSSGMGDPRTGVGLGVRSRNQVTEMVRQMDIRDPTMNTEDLSQILQQSSQLGLFSGTHDMNDFQKKFKDIVQNVKVVTRTLHQTLEEGLKTIKDLRAIGVDPSQASGIVTSADTLGKMSGRTAAEMINVGLQGAELFRGTGVAMSIGMQANMMNTASVRAARDAGQISQEAIAQAGGEEALAQRLTAGGLGFAQTGFGRGYGAAFFNRGMAGGGGTGFNQGAFTQTMMQGGGDLSQMVTQAAQNLGSPAGLIQYQANQAKILSEMGKTFGGQGLQVMAYGAAMSQAQMLHQATGAPTEASFRYVLQSQGRSESEIEAILGQMKNASGAFESAQRSAGAVRSKLVLEEAAQNTLLYRAYDRVGDWGKSVVDIAARPLNNAVSDTSEWARRTYNERYLGVKEFNVSDVAYAGLAGKEAQLRSMGVTELQQTGPVDLSKSGGQSIARLLGDKDGTLVALGISTSHTYDSRTGGVKIGETGQYDAARNRYENVYLEGDLNKASATAYRLLTLTEEQKTDIRKNVSDDAKRSVQIQLGKSGGAVDLPDLVRRVYHKNLTDLTQEEYVNLRDEAQGTSDFAPMFDAAEKSGRALITTNANISAARVASAADAERAIRKSITGSSGWFGIGATGLHGVDVSSSVLVKMAEARLSKDADVRALAVNELTHLKDRNNVNVANAAQANKIIDNITEEQAKSVLGGVLAVTREQVGRGWSTLQSGFQATWHGDVGTQQKADAIFGKLISGAESPSKAILSISDSDIKDFEKGGYTNFSAQKRDLQALEKATAKGVLDTNAVSKIITNKEQFAAFSETFAKSGQTAALDTYTKFAASKAAGSTGMIGDSSLAGAGAAVDSAQERYAILTNTNVQTLNIMTALARKLGY